ncbi:MAG: twin-arginine translocase subunit TatB [Rhodoplanes sp.]|uniref:Sec-independent protein translocase protein TatB n=1 Tax=Rhodoplanes sp. TaxID=1968906 RepID=UPI0018039CDF|nr:Sec-independent protein translocase protein TatB [Rhodoplanes sp.]NVO13753.1 twin-arginine translocase subunit TatB [Rhodoplanes sp.]
MFDIGWSELLLIGVVALIAIGPKELPGVLRAVGQWTGKIRRMAAEFQGQFQEALREAEMADLKKHVDDLNDAARSFTNFDPMAEQPKPAAPTTVSDVAGGDPPPPSETALPGEAAAAEPAPLPAPSSEPIVASGVPAETPTAPAATAPATVEPVASVAPAGAEPPTPVAPSGDRPA